MTHDNLNLLVAISVSLSFGQVGDSSSSGVLGWDLPLRCGIIEHFSRGLHWCTRLSRFGVHMSFSYMVLLKGKNEIFFQWRTASIVRYRLHTTLEM